MKGVPRFRDILGKISVALVSELDQICLRINDWSSHEHNGDGKHEAITVTSITFKSATGTTIVSSADGVTPAQLTADSLGQVVIANGTEPWEGHIVVCAGDGNPATGLAVLLASPSWPSVLSPQQ